MFKKFFAALLAISCFTAINSQSLSRIPISAFSAYANQHVKDDFNKLVDGDVSTLFTVWNPQIKPYQVTFPLDSFDNCIIKRLTFYITSGNPSTLKYYIVRKDNGEKLLLSSYTGGNWIQAYQTVDLQNTIAAKAFVIESNGGGDFPSEIQLYGSYTSHQFPTTNPKLSPLSELLGVVCKPWDICDWLFPEKIPQIQDLKVSRVRLYNDYDLTHNSDGTWKMNQLDGWRQVGNMQLLKSKGISTQMCYLAFPYYPFSGDRTDPATYTKLAKDIYDFGIDNKANGEYFKTVEVGNEMDMWYNNDFANYYLDGYQLAAMMSICYDGHKGKYPNVGLKASGSQAEVSMCGLAESEPYILYQVMEWSEKNRGYRADGTIDLPFDIYSYHCYSSLEGQRQGIQGGISPEFGMAQYMRKITTIRNNYFPWLKIHIGEWGWDISPNSSLNAPAFGKYSANQTSAMWTVRTLLAMAENGINASSYYRIKSDYDALDDGSYTPFATMALLRAESGGVKQPDGSYLGMGLHRTLTGDYFRQFAEFFNDGYVFAGRISESPNVLKFTKGSKDMYVIWETETMTVTDRPNFTESTGSFVLNKNGTLRRFVDDGSGVMSSQLYFSGTKLNVDAKPIVIIVNNSTPLPIKLLSFTGTKQANSTLLQWKVDQAVNFDRFEVERLGDGSKYTKLLSQSYLSGLNSYQLTDNSPLSGSNYYRLKLINKDGTFTYSVIVKVEFAVMRYDVEVFNYLGQLIKRERGVYPDQFKHSLEHNNKFILRFSNPIETYTEKY